MKKTLLVLAMGVTFLMFSCKPEKEDNNSNEVISEPTTGIINGHEWVDLGLPSGLKWATCNVGANAPKEYGGYYAWGETETKTEYTEDNSFTDGEEMNDISGDSQFDAATVNWGGSWRMPTKEEIDELVENCTSTWVTQDSVNGYKIVGTNGNSVFFPAAGYCFGSLLYDVEYYGNYWSSTPDKDSCYYGDAYSFFFNNASESVGDYYRGLGQTIRPVSD